MGSFLLVYAPNMKGKPAEGGEELDGSLIDQERPKTRELERGEKG